MRAPLRLRLEPSWAILLTRELCPRLDRRLSWLRTPIAGLTVGILASLLCGLGLHERAYIVALGLSFVLSLGVAWPWMIMRGMRGELRFERDRVQEGEAVGVSLQLRNRCPWPVWGSAVRGLDSLGGTSGEASLPEIGPFSEVNVTWPFVPQRRGVYPRGRVRLANGFPFGIRECSRSLEVHQPLIVWPRTLPVVGLPEAAWGESAIGLACRNKPGLSGEMLGVRPYRRGDSLRRVHWPQTARHGAIVVCELQEQAQPRVYVVLDLHADAHEGQGPDSSEEWTIRVAASLVESWIRLGAEVELLVDGSPLPTNGDSSHQKRRALMDCLASLEAPSGRSLESLLGCLPPSTQGLQVVVTTERAFCRLPHALARNPRHRFVVLDGHRLAGFDHRSRQPLPATPWIHIEDPERLRTRITVS